MAGLTGLLKNARYVLDVFFGVVFEILLFVVVNVIRCQLYFPPIFSVLGAGC